VFLGVKAIKRRAGILMVCLSAVVLLLSPPQISGNPVIAPYLNKMFGIRNGIDQVRVMGKGGWGDWA
jgi:hypothetical protein